MKPFVLDGAIEKLARAYLATLARGGSFVTASPLPFVDACALDKLHTLEMCIWNKRNGVVTATDFGIHANDLFNGEKT